MELNIRNIRKKAQGLPLETIVIAVIVIIVLVVIIGIFIGGTSDAGDDSKQIKNSLAGCNVQNPLIEEGSNPTPEVECNTDEKQVTATTKEGFVCCVTK